jgi:PRTRC genetic system ThiF family protein
MSEFAIPGHLLSRSVKVLLVGAGGNGSRMLTGLAELDRAMRALGHPGGLDVTTMDFDLVSDSNVGRQAFYPADVGLSKAIVLTHRINVAYGLDWTAEFKRLSADTRVSADLVIGAVDNRAARRDIHAALQSCDALWLDLGNQETSGQAILGQTLPTWTRPEDSPDRLPTVIDLFPDILDPTIPEDNTPSCSMAEALNRQDLFINRAVSDWGLNLLWRLFRRGKIDHHGIFVNLATGRTTPLPVNPEAWARFGYQVPMKKPRARRKAA